MRLPWLICSEEYAGHKLRKMADHLDILSNPLAARSHDSSSSSSLGPCTKETLETLHVPISRPIHQRARAERRLMSATQRDAAQDRRPSLQLPDRRAGRGMTRRVETMTKNPPDAIHPGIRKILPEDIEAVLQLFDLVFGRVASRELLKWKYAPGKGEALGVWDEQGCLIAHCGIFYRDVLAGGLKVRAAQLGDLMANPNKPGSLARELSPFHRLIRAVLATLPSPANPGGVAFGFPSDRAMRLGERLGVFATIDRMFELEFPVRHCWTARPRIIEQLTPRSRNAIDRLWGKMASDLAQFVAGVRDSNYIAWRYLSHPSHKHVIGFARSLLGRPRGVFVLRDTGEGWELLDVVASLHDIPTTIAAASDVVARRAGTRLTMWLASTHAEQFARLAIRSTPTEFRIMANPLGEADFRRDFDHRWWLTSGDTDYR